MLTNEHHHDNHNRALVLRPTPFDPQRALEIVALAHGIELEQAL